MALFLILKLQTLYFPQFTSFHIIISKSPKIEPLLLFLISSFEASNNCSKYKFIYHFFEMPYKLFQVFLYCFSLLFLKFIYMIFEVSIILYILFPQFVLFSEFPVSPPVRYWHRGYHFYRFFSLVFLSLCRYSNILRYIFFFKIIKLWLLHSVFNYIWSVVLPGYSKGSA